MGITGSTGRLGGRVARRLEAAQVAQRLLVRDLGRAPALAGAQAVQAEYADTDAVAAALAGVETVLMVSGSEAPDRVQHHRSFVDGAVRAGVSHVVYTSFFGASPTATFTLGRDHWATEEYLFASGLGFTLLRNNLYSNFFPFLVGDDGVLRGPAGHGRVAAVAQDDIADAAVAVLRRPGDHLGATYNLTGPESLSLAEVAATITQVTGRTVSYHPESLEEAYASRARYGAPGWQVDAWVSTYTSIAAGEMDGASTDIETVAGHPATPLADVLSAS